MKTVLNRMLDMEYINQEQYEEALEYDLVADFKEEEKSPFEEYPVLSCRDSKKCHQHFEEQTIRRRWYY